MFGKYNIFQYVYGGLAKFLNEQISPGHKTMYMVLLAVVYFQIVLYILDGITPPKISFGIVAFGNLWFILKYDRMWLDNKFRKK